MHDCCVFWGLYEGRFLGPCHMSPTRPRSNTRSLRVGGSEHMYVTNVTPSSRTSVRCDKCHNGYPQVIPACCGYCTCQGGRCVTFVTNTRSNEAPRRRYNTVIGPLRTHGAAPLDNSVRNEAVDSQKHPSTRAKHRYRGSNPSTGVCITPLLNTCSLV